MAVENEDTALLDRPGTPFEPRLKCAVGNCCLPTYSGIHEHMLTHCFPNFIPGWNQYGDHQVAEGEYVIE